jgi:hypothetical protein
MCGTAQNTLPNGKGSSCPFVNDIIVENNFDPVLYPKIYNNNAALVSSH